MPILQETRELIKRYENEIGHPPTLLYCGKRQIKEFISECDKLFMLDVIQEDGKITEVTGERFLGLEIIRVQKENFLGVGIRNFL